MREFVDGNRRSKAPKERNVFVVMSGFNYNKWDNIELSDDESDLHPNIDKDSWFRMKHRSRLEREAQEDEEVKKIGELNKDDTARLNIVNKQLDRIRGGGGDDGEDDVEALEGEAAELEKGIAKRKERVAQIEERRSWNMENICKIKEEKTIVNSIEVKSLAAVDFAPTGETEMRLELNKAEAMAEGYGTEKVVTKAPSSNSPAPSLSTFSTSATAAPTPSAGPLEAHEVPGARENFSVMSYNDFVLKHERILEEYSILEDLESSKKFLFKHCDILLHEHSQNYMLLSCLEDEMNGKRARCNKVCRQSQLLSHIQELGQSMGRDPRDVILPLFSRLEEKVHSAAFLEQVEEFKKRIYKRAVEKRKEMDDEKLLNEEANAPLGPGGLNPFTVLRELPEPLRNAFESQDIERLQRVLDDMDPAEAKRCMKRCADSGLWNPADPSALDESEDMPERKDEEID